MFRSLKLISALSRPELSADSAARPLRPIGAASRSDGAAGESDAVRGSQDESSPSKNEGSRLTTGAATVGKDNCWADCMFTSSLSEANWLEQLIPER